MSDPGGWQVILTRQPQKVLRKLPQDVLQRISRALDELSKDARPSGCKKLAGYDNLFRLRVGDWRIVYAIEDERLVILVLEVVPRGDAYRGL
jgi:mRNA interferase RelE/StbE